VTNALATSLALALDPVYLAIAAGIRPDEWQAELLRSDARQLLLLVTRQGGKSTVSALLALHEAVARPPALVLLLAPALRQSQELFRKVKGMLHVLGDRAPLIARESALTLELVTGSRIVSLPGNDATIRGFSNVALVVVDEAARAPDSLYQAVRPMVAVSGGRIVLLSTPFGARGFFHREATEGAADWHRVTVTADQCPRIDPAWLARERVRIGDWWYRQEYLCEFVQNDENIFRYDTVMSALSDEVHPLLFALRAAG
jgi:hypothetical protein